MRNSCLKQIQSLGVTLPFDFKLSSPLKIVPVVFFSTKNGTFCKDVLFNRIVPSEYPSLKDLFENACVCDLVFVKREYDGSEIYYMVCAFTYKEIDVISKFLNLLKGGILL